MHTGFLLGDLRERDNLVNPDVDGSCILICILSRKRIEVMGWIDLAQKNGQMTCCCECDNERADSIKQGNFLTS